MRALGNNWGDSLAAHGLFGFLSPSARHFCRLCLVDRAEMQYEFRSSMFQKRNKAMHDQQIQLSLRNNDTSSGVRENSILHQSRFFHVTENYCFDAMHDLLEGVCPMEVKLILNQLLFVEPTDGLNILILNRRIHAFRYGLADKKNKPSANFTKASLQNVKDHNLKQTAAQMWCLVRVLPFILFDMVQNNDYLYLLQLLLRIMEIVFAPAVSHGMACYLEELCIEHHQKFKELFPDTNLINKHHHMLHYADCMVKFGPLVRMWCMRYEAKHNFFKRRANINCNFKNIAKSLANAHQLAHCAAWNLEGGLNKTIKFTSEEQVPIASCLSQALLLELGYSINDIVKVARTAVYCGTEYRCNIFICHKYDSNNYPTFAKITELLILNDEDVDGTTFLDLNDEDLRNVSIKLGSRKKILKIILNEKENIQPDHSLDNSNISTYDVELEVLHPQSSSSFVSSLSAETEKINAQSIVTLNHFNCSLSPFSSPEEHFFDPISRTGLIEWRLKTLRVKASPSKKKNKRKRGISETDTEEQSVDEEVFASKITWLKYQIPSDLHKKEIFLTMNETFEVRRQFIKRENPSIGQVLMKYPKLKDFKGDLIDAEFVKMFPDAGNFLGVFPSYYAPRIVKYVSNCRPDLARRFSEVVDGMTE
ncbi:hypothetical protein AVEN_176850-1 [Araneus ventricosus]|uniref:Uncharacterized protein n=1 Tax=Araneus ventricosus TaxID=182803 RepID=A0A4Y2CXF9_ARAVE|nr:hypothetical protein AVEN_176850-1 [Araneus ventricosus]